MALDRRRVVHRSSANTLQTLSRTKDAIDSQIASGDLVGWPNVTTEVTNMQAMLTAQHAALQTWYTNWRGREAPEPPTPGFLGVLGSFSDYETNLKSTASIPLLARNNYEAMGLIAMVYEELYANGLALETTAPGLKEIAMDGLEAAIPLVESLSETVCVATIRELHNEDNTIPMSIATTAVSDTQAAWNA